MVNAALEAYAEGFRPPTEFFSANKSGSANKSRKFASRPERGNPRRRRPAIGTGRFEVESNVNETSTFLWK
jgi:hypothetical protein